MSIDQKLMTVKEVAHFLRLSLAETYRLVNSKALTHFRVGPGRGAIRIQESDVATFLENRRQGQLTPPTGETHLRRAAKPLKHIQVRK